MRCKHEMPYGAQVLDDGLTRFGLWAPGAKAVGVQLDHLNGSTRTTRLALAALAEGWFEAIVDDAPAGTRYRYVIDGKTPVPDPASRFNPEDVSGPSEVIDPALFEWRDTGWRGRPWEEAVIYELHVGTFTPEGSFKAIQGRLDALRDIGITAIELMPIADFPGRRNWGYDGVLPFAPDSAYGRPDDLRELIQAAHERGLMMFLDVVYNHFGPEGNYLSAYAPQFFTERHKTPWGAAINFDSTGSAAVREFFINNALYWLNEYRFDGLRLDAVHAIMDESSPDFLQALAARVAAGPGQERQVHLVLENDNNAAHYLERQSSGAHYAAQWNDDIHHAFHVLATGETDGYYSDYAEAPHARLARCLAEGFAFQGDASPFRGGERRGEPSAYLPPQAFVSFLQNHDQIGNRAFGERMASLAPPDALRALVAVQLLAPSPPLLFMGEEFGATTPFLFFCDFSGELAQAVTEGRRSEFAKFAAFDDPRARERIPDPSDEQTFLASKLDWQGRTQPPHSEWLRLYRELLAIRRAEIVPRLRGSGDLAGHAGSYRVFGERALCVQWTMGEGSVLCLLANLADAGSELDESIFGRVLYQTTAPSVSSTSANSLNLAPWTVLWTLSEPSVTASSSA